MILVNGKPSNSIKTSDRGLNYGDGLFETMTVVDGQVRFLEAHLDRLVDGCRKLLLPAPNVADLHGDINLLCEATQDNPFVIKIIITRGSLGRGYLASADAQLTRISTAHPFPADTMAYWNNGLSVHVCSTRMAINPRFAGIKHLNRLEQVLASMERADSDDYDEGLVLSMDGSIVEGTKSNLFWRKKDAFFTPDISDNGVAGVARAKVIELLEAGRQKISIGKYDLSDVLGADLVFMTNSTMLISQVVALQDQTWSPNPLINTLREQLVELA